MYTLEPIPVQKECEDIPPKPLLVRKESVGKNALKLKKEQERRRKQKAIKRGGIEGLLARKEIGGMEALKLEKRPRNDVGRGG